MDNATNDTNNDSMLDCEYSCARVGLVVRDVIFLIVGLTGNFCLLTIIFKKMRSVPNYLIANLTVVDTGFLILFLPYEIVLNLNTDFTFIRSELGCKISEYLRIVFMGVSIFTLTALSVDRYLAVAKPLSLRSLRSGRKRLCAVLLGTALIWVGSLIVCFPNLIMAQFDSEHLSCYVNPWHNFFKPYIYSVMVIYLGVPTCIIIFSYCCMARSLLKRNHLLESHGARAVSSRQRHQRVRLAVAVIIIVIVFVATWSIFYICELLRHHQLHVDMNTFDTHTWFKVLNEIAMILLRVNPVINPIILFTVSSSHRHYAKLTFCCCLPDKKTHKFGKSISLTSQCTTDSRLHKNSEFQKTKREMQV